MVVGNILTWRCVCVCFLAGMEISEEQRKQAIVNARRAKQGKNKSKKIFCFMPFSHSNILIYIHDFDFFVLPVYLLAIGYSGSTPPHHQNLHPLHQRHITIPTSVPQQQVFSLAEPPKRKPYHLLYNITRNAFFKKWGFAPSSFFIPAHVQRTTKPSWRLKKHFSFFPAFFCL